MKITICKHADNSILITMCKKTGWQCNSQRGPLMYQGLCKDEELIEIETENKETRDE